MKYSRPPFPIRVLNRMLPKDLLHLVGDLEEEYRWIQGREGASRARTSLYFQCIRSTPFFLGQAFKWNLIMTGHYLKIGIRLIRRHLSFSAINVFGLAVGMSICLLLMLFLLDQMSYDRFHEDAGRIYRVTSTFKSPGSDEAGRYASSPANMAELIQQSVPGVELAIHVRDGFQGEIWSGDNSLSLSGLWASGEIFEMFDFPLLLGDAATALKEPGSIILSRESADRLFGPGLDPVGKTITALGDREYTVTGVVRAQTHSHLKFDSLVSMASITSSPDYANRLGDWRESIFNSYTFVKLEPGAGNRLEQVLPDLIATHFQDPEGESILEAAPIQPLTGISLGEPLSNEIGVVIPNVFAWFAIGFGLVVLLLACFNYVSLTIARGINRSREVGVRRALGAYSGSIFRQFMMESVLMSVLALVLAVGMLWWMLPRFNTLFLINMSENQIAIDLGKDYGVYLVFLAFSVLIGLAAGLYPARFFTDIEPVGALGGTRPAGKMSRHRLRKVITVVQFTFSIIFLISSIVLVRQFRYMSHADYGFNEEFIVNVALQDVPFERLQSTLEDNSLIQSMAASSKIPAMGSIDGVWMESDETAEHIRAHSLSVDGNYIRTMKLNLLAGRDFDANQASDSLGAVILGRSAVTALGLGTPLAAIGQNVSVEEQPYSVVGIIDDFMSSDPASAGDPIVLLNRPADFRYAVVKMQPGSVDKFLPELTRTWAGVGSLYTPKYEVFDEQLRNNPLVVVFGDFLRIFGVIAFFTVLISCLGLLGMAMYSSQNRIREIGIRKVLGASESNILLLLSREYLILIGIAVLIGGPAAWLLNSLWLSAMSNRIDLNPITVVAGVVGTVLIALLTITSQTFRASRTGVVENLRTE